jgi:hypothetical protein
MSRQYTRTLCQAIARRPASPALARYSQPRRLDKISPDVIRGKIMQINEGGCLCSAIRFRISGEPIYSSICHCATCRRASAAPAVAWLTFDRGQIEILSGQPRTYRSSLGVVRQFCGTCGSQLLYENAASPTTVDITTSSMDNPNLFPPNLEVWLEHRVSWQTADQSRAHYPRGNQ